MKTIQSILFLAFISGFSILMINSGRVSPQIEQQQNSYWTVIANAQSAPAYGFDFPEPAYGYDIPETVSKSNLAESKAFSPPVETIPTRSSGYHPGYGRGGNANRKLSAANNNSAQSMNPLHSRIIKTTLQPLDLIISPEEAANYATTLNAKMQYINIR